MLQVNCLVLYVIEQKFLHMVTFIRRLQDDIAIKLKVQLCSVFSRFKNATFKDNREVETYRTSWDRDTRRAIKRWHIEERPTEQQYFNTKRRGPNRNKNWDPKRSVSFLNISSLVRFNCWTILAVFRETSESYTGPGTTERAITSRTNSWPATCSGSRRTTFEYSAQ